MRGTVSVLMGFKRKEKRADCMSCPHKHIVARGERMERENKNGIHGERQINIEKAIEKKKKEIDGHYPREKGREKRERDERREKKEINILRDKRVEENDRDSYKGDNERSLGRRDLLRLYKTAHRI